MKCAKGDYILLRRPQKILLLIILKIWMVVLFLVYMEGDRPFLVEVQALVGSAVYGVPQRTANGFN